MSINTIKPVPTGDTEPTKAEILEAQWLAEGRASSDWSEWEELRALRGGFWLIHRRRDESYTARKLTDLETVAWYVDSCVETTVAPLIRAAIGIRKGGAR